MKTSSSYGVDSGAYEESNQCNQCNHTSSAAWFRLNTCLARGEEMTGQFRCVETLERRGETGAVEHHWSGPSLITQTLLSVINGEPELVSCIVTDQKAGKG